MGKHRRLSDDPPQETGAADSGATYWSVDGAHWPSVRPSLPAEMVDLLAPPIVVGVARVAGTSRLAPPVEVARHSGAPRTPGPVRSGLPAGRPVPAGASTVRFASAAASHPAGPAGSVPGGAPNLGRHRGGPGPLDRNA